MPRDPLSNTPQSAAPRARPPRGSAADFPRPGATPTAAARLNSAAASPVEFFAADDSELLVTGEAVALDRRAAGFVLRGAGAAIDVIVVLALAVAAMLVLSSEYVNQILDPSYYPAIAISVVVMLTVALPTAVETLTQGKSLGKLAVGVRIVRDDGGSIGFRHAFIRALVGLLEIFLTLGGLAALVALLNPQAKRIGDLLSGCYARNERVQASPVSVVELPAGLAVWAQTADVARLPDRLAGRVSSFLAQSSAMLPATRHRLALSLAEETAPLVSELPAGVLAQAHTANPDHPAAPGTAGATGQIGAEEDFLRAVTVLRRDRDASSLQRAQNRLDRFEPALRALPHGFPDRG